MLAKIDGIQILKGGIPKVTLLFEPSQKAEVVALPEVIEIYPEGRIITLDERASEKFAAIMNDLDAVLNKHRNQPDMPSSGGEHAGSLY